MDIDFEQRRKAFEVYFKEHSFLEFEKLMGVSVEEFRDTYDRYKEFVQDFYDNYVPEEDTLHPLVAEICPYIELDYLTALESLRSLVRYPAVKVFKGEYYATSERPKIDFLECDEVMKRLLELYKINEEFFEEGRKLVFSTTNNPFSPEGLGLVEAGKEDYPF